MKSDTYAGARRRQPTSRKLGSLLSGTLNSNPFLNFFFFNFCFYIVLAFCAAYLSSEDATDHFEPSIIIVLKIFRTNMIRSRTIY